MWELRGLGEVNQELERRKGRLLAISVDPPEKSREVIEKQHLPFPILSDTERKVIRDFGILHEGGGLHGEDIAVPAMFLIDRNGNLAWSRKAKRITDRPTPHEVLEAVHAL